MIVVLLVVDSLRADAPGFAGGADTPAMDRLAAEGTAFSETFASGAWTIPSLLSMLTGSLGHRLGVCRWRHPFPAGRPTLLTAMAAAGFEVACFHPYPRWGFLTVAGKGRVGNSQDPAAVGAALRGRKEQDRFVLVHHWWTHVPYVNRELTRSGWHAACDFAIDSLARYPERIAPRLRDSYRKAVTYFSESLLPRYAEAAAAGGEDVLIALTGDHGETWGDSLPAGARVRHVFDLHGRWITDETVRVPLVFWGRAAGGAVPAGRRIDGMVCGADIGPTIADLAGVPWPGPIPDRAGPDLVDREIEDLEIVGRSLAPAIRDDRPTGRDEVVTVSSHNTHEPDVYPEDGRKMWRTFALRDRRAWHVYDGVDKTRAVRAVGDESAGDAQDAVFARLAAMHERAVDPAPIVADEHLDALRSVDDEVRGRLRSLGYLD